MNFKENFIALTKQTVPFHTEDNLLPLLPKGLKKDSAGNYHITIGSNPTTLFTCHLDTASDEIENVNHIIDGNIIRTDGSTILGADDKAGVCILIYLIEQNVKGTYYFFIGEEIGCLGSQMALKYEGDFFKQFKRAIAFDRRGKEQILTHQRGVMTASVDFADTLCEEYKKNGMSFEPAHGGMTDTGIFINVIPECTNISAGYFDEHTKYEYVDIDYVERLAKASALIDWENLPTVRNSYTMKHLERFQYS